MKTRLISQGYSQSCIYFNETFALFACIGIIHMVIVLTIEYCLSISTRKFWRDHLYGNPEVFWTNLGNIGQRNFQKYYMNCKKVISLSLSKSLYDPKQVERSWYQKLNKALAQIETEPLKADSCLYWICKMMKFNSNNLLCTIF